MYRFKSIKYLTATGLITALLLVIGYLSSLCFTWTISAFGSMTTLQLFDTLYIPFCAIFKGPMMLFAGAIAGAIIDLASGIRIINIPVTILIRILMFLIIKLLTNHRWWSSIYSFFLAVVILITGYFLSYVIIYHDRAIVINELITDAIQGTFAYFASLLLYYYLSCKQKKANNYFLNDQQFDDLKIKKKEIYHGEKNGNW